MVGVQMEGSAPLQSLSFAHVGANQLGFGRHVTAERVVWQLLPACPLTLQYRGPSPGLP